MMQATPHASISAIGDRHIGPLINAHIDRTFRRIMPGADTVIERNYVRLETGEAHPFANFACLNDSTDAACTREAIAPLVSHNALAAVFYVGTPAPSVLSHLTQSGFARHGQMVMMAVDLDRLATTALPAGYAFARVSAAADRERWGDVFARGYELPPRCGASFARGIDGTIADDAEIQYFWILRGDAPVATSVLFMFDGVAGIYGVSTLPDQRNKGLGAHVTAEALRTAQKLGYRVGILQASMAGHPVYRRLGFSDFGEIPLFVRMPAMA